MRTRRNHHASQTSQRATMASAPATRRRHAGSPQQDVERPLRVAAATVDGPEQLRPGGCAVRWPRDRGRDRECDRATQAAARVTSCAASADRSAAEPLLDAEQDERSEPGPPGIARLRRAPGVERHRAWRPRQRDEQSPRRPARLRARRRHRGSIRAFSTALTTAAAKRLSTGASTSTSSSAPEAAARTSGFPSLIRSQRHPGSRNGRRTGLDRRRR